MSGNNKNIKPSDFKEYFSDKLSSDNKTNFENSIEKESFEGEALDGFRSLENNKMANDAIEDLENEIRKRTGAPLGKSKKHPFWKPLSIAASLVLIFGTVYYSTNLFKNTEFLADNKSIENIEDTSQEEIINDHLLNDDGKNINEEVEVLDDLISVELEAAEKNIKATDEKVKNTNENLLLVDKSKAKTKVEDELIASREITQVNMEKLPSAAPQNSSEDSDVSNRHVKSTLRSENSIGLSNFQKGKTNYLNKSYNEAISDFQRAIGENEKNIESEYYIGMSYFKLETYNKALKSFNYVIDSKTHLSDNAKWFKSIILLEQGKSAESKTILRELGEGDSGFKEQAIEILNKIN